MGPFAYGANGDYSSIVFNHLSFPHQTSTNFKTLIGLVILQKLAILQPSCNRTLDNIVSSSDSGNSSFLFSLELNAVFDSNDHAILLSRLNTSFGFDGLVYYWIKSYLTDRFQMVTSEKNPLHLLMLPLMFPKVLFSILFFSAYTPPQLLLLLPLSLFYSSSSISIGIGHRTFSILISYFSKYPMSNSTFD